jgi:hypothetical protein
MVLSHRRARLRVCSVLTRPDALIAERALLQLHFHLLHVHTEAALYMMYVTVKCEA